MYISNALHSLRLFFCFFLTWYLGLCMGLYDATFGTCNDSEVSDMKHECYWQELNGRYALSGHTLWVLVICIIDSGDTLQPKSTLTCMALSRISSRRTTGRVCRLNWTRIDHIAWPSTPEFNDRPVIKSVCDRSPSAHSWWEILGIWCSSYSFWIRSTAHRECSYVIILK